MTNSSMIPLKMTRTFAVPPEKVYEAWLTPSLFNKWLFTLQNTNQVAENTPEVGGKWEIVDRRDGKDYRAIGEYLELDRPNLIVMTFGMPQFNDETDKISVELRQVPEGTEMTFIHNITVPHEEGWTNEDIENAMKAHHDSTEHGWSLMFRGLKEIAETGKVSFKG